MVKNEPDNVKNRLAILYAISLLGKSAPLRQIEEIFTEHLAINTERFEAMLEDISSSDLLRVIEKNKGRELLITENGLVVLSFFQDKLETSVREAIEEAMTEEDLLGVDYEWESWYEKRTGMLHVMLLEDNKKIMSLQLSVAEEDYDDLFPLDLPKKREVCMKMFELLKELNHKE